MSFSPKRAALAAALASAALLDDSDAAADEFKLVAGATFTASPGPASLFVSADGGEGNDTLVGSEELDSIVGGPGDAQTDELTVDSVSGVEHLDATEPPPPPPDTVAILPQLGKVTVIRHGRKLIAKAPLSCPAAEAGGCHTTLRVEATKPRRPGGMARRVVLGSKIVELGPGAQTKVSIPFVSGAAELANDGKLAARIRIASSDAAGNTAVRTTAVILRIPRI